MEQQSKKRKRLNSGGREGQSQHILVLWAYEKYCTFLVVHLARLLSPFSPFSPRLQPGLHRVVVERYDGRPQQHPQHPAHVAKERGEAVVVVLGRDGELWPGDGDADGGVAFAAVLGAVRSAVSGRGEKGGGSEDSLDAQAVGGGGAAGDAASLTDQLPYFCVGG